MQMQFIDSQKVKIHDIRYWRARLFMNFMLFVLPVGVVVYIPSMIMSIIDDLSVVAVVNTLVLVVAIILMFNKKINLEKKKYLFAACLYILSTVLLFYLGSMGPGLLYLIAVSIFIVLIISNKAAYVSICLNILIYVLLSIGLSFANLEFKFFETYSLGSWIAVGSNFILINIVTVLSTSALLNGLQKTILKENTLQKSLIEESTKLKEAKDKAIQSARFKSAFLANMSHEIRTPLNAIVGFANILQKKKDPKNQKLYVDIINKSSGQLLSLINDIIDLSKIEAGAATLEIEKIRLGDFIETLVGSMKGLCPDKLEFNYKVDNSDLKEIIGIDIQKVTQIITNLITNSFKYTHEGFVELSISLSDDKQTFAFHVKDTGIGICPEKQQQVFQRFYQENAMHCGVGLGLSICASLVKAMNGKIGMESDEGKGSIFFVEIPNILTSNYAELKENTIDTHPANEIRAKKILIAEDDENSFAVLKELLKEGKHAITRTDNGNEAIEQIKNHNFDVVLMDLKMPVLDGYEATKQIRSFDMKTPIIAVTAYAFDSDAEKALQAGCNDYLSKPISVHKLYQLLSKYSS